MLFCIAQYHTGPSIKKKIEFFHFHNDPTVLFEHIYITIVYGARWMNMGIKRLAMVLIKTPMVRTTIHALWVHYRHGEFSFLLRKCQKIYFGVKINVL
jgi:hypothetical protein